MDFIIAGTMIKAYFSDGAVQKLKLEWWLWFIHDHKINQIFRHEHVHFIRISTVIVIKAYIFVLSNHKNTQLGNANNSPSK